MFDFRCGFQLVYSQNMIWVYCLRSKLGLRNRRTGEVLDFNVGFGVYSQNLFWVVFGLKIGPF